MSNLSFLKFQNGLSFSRGSSLNKTQSQSPHNPQTQKISTSKTGQKSGLKTNSFHSNAEEMKWVFDKYDTNKDGKISLEEYKSALRALDKGIPEAEAANLFKIMDTDGDGFIDFKEFIEMFDAGEKVKPADIQSAFQVFDLDGNGKISAKELFQVLKKLGEGCSLSSCKNVVKGVDTNGDGLIDVNEFMKMMTSRQEKPF
ncbi:calmodulin-like protein 1 [Quillaja saponaria]|uniref:Calmodulin-like protein 1 n=1 Tax=Quillaja saponaria TaxID=32244 RepID=A0AAD7KQY4_QUISA|nr:calmodulin-like protein 1 [Quillaja saponaria]